MLRPYIYRRKVCSNLNDFRINCRELEKTLQNRGYNQTKIEAQTKKVYEVERESLLKYKEKPISTKIPLPITYNPTIPNIHKAIANNWHILQINKDFANIFKEKPVIAYKRNRNLRDYLVQRKIVNNKALRSSTLKPGQCSPCLSRVNNQCCKQVLQTKEFRSNITQKTYIIFHRLNCKSKHLIYLLECRKCKLQYIGKCETAFNLRLNNHRKDSTKEDAIPASKHFNTSGHNFSTDAKFTLIEQLKIENHPNITETLKNREDFWIIKLQTLSPKGLNHELNNPQLL